MEIKETVQVSENTVNSVSAPRNLLASDSAYDTLQTSFFQSLSINRGDQSEKSVPKCVNKSVMSVNCRITVHVTRKMCISHQQTQNV